VELHRKLDGRLPVPPDVVVVVVVVARVVVVDVVEAVCVVVVDVVPVPEAQPRVMPAGAPLAWKPNWVDCPAAMVAL